MQKHRHESKTIYETPGLQVFQILVLIPLCDAVKDFQGFSPEETIFTESWEIRFTPDVIQ